jgi:quercetin dioxygenase-like cupin family protein
MDERQHRAIWSFVSERTPRPLAGELLSFDLAHEVASLRDEAQASKGHNCRTLIKLGGLRLVLATLAAGARIQEHHSTEPLAFHPLSGHVALQLREQILHLRPEQLAAVDRNASYTLEAIDDSALLIWVGWQETA